MKTNKIELAMDTEFKAKQVADLLRATTLICELRELTSNGCTVLSDKVEELNEAILNESHRIITGEETTKYNIGGK
tara:strand:+ start:618 stop:845 length:228 start_codon:yes stop_codon:yes gene_type:complete